MRIAVVHPYSWPSVRRGGERYAHDLTWWLARQGHDVSLVTGAGDVDADDGVRVVGLPLKPGTRFSHHGVTALDTFGLTVLPHLAQERYDVVHSLVPSGAVAAALALRPSVWTALGHPTPANPPARRWSLELIKRGARSARVVASLSASAADGLEQLVGRRPVVLPPGTRSGTFPLSTAPREPVLLFPAFAADPRKRLSVLLEALPAVLAVHPDLRLQLVGGGDASALLAAASSEVRAAVDDLGAVPDLLTRYQRAAVTVLPSVEEAFGLVVVESMSCGTPVVCTSSGGTSELVDDEVGAVAPPDDATGLAAAVLRALALSADPSTAQRCADHARWWDWDGVGPQHELVYARARG